MGSEWLKDQRREGLALSAQAGAPVCPITPHPQSLNSSPEYSTLGLRVAQDFEGLQRHGKEAAPEEIVGSQPWGDVASLREKPIVKELAVPLRGSAEHMCV